MIVIGSELYAQRQCQQRLLIIVTWRLSYDGVDKNSDGTECVTRVNVQQVVLELC